MALATVGAQAPTGCGLLTDPTVTVNVGYESKAINTVNAGTLQRDSRAFEDALAS
ncbi:MULTISPECIES: hypothetical protein [Mycobacteriaceae]|uniref:Uncharacterized protein n=1 Tax=Mycolicibacterium austroafricanum TaxID=39687 RepID=A0ABT8HNI3_MYCAO|nr:MULTISPECIES: hypothetical protein [Mycobacteriaceae]MDN4521822.1 hypothetical protein [Mycolicibacterium austroafricanum]